MFMSQWKVYKPRIFSAHVIYQLIINSEHIPKESVLQPALLKYE